MTGTPNTFPKYSNHSRNILRLRYSPGFRNPGERRTRSIQWHGKLAQKERGSQFPGSTQTARRKSRGKRDIPALKRIRAQLSTRHLDGNYQKTARQLTSLTDSRQVDSRCGVRVTSISTKYPRSSASGLCVVPMVITLNSVLM